MSKRKTSASSRRTSKDAIDPSSSLPASEAAASAGSGESSGSCSSNVVVNYWKRPAKILVSLWLCYHLLAMFASPWAIPPASSLARSAQWATQHYQTALYLNHGYRFFAPNPGPASVIIYRMELPDGRRAEGVFPDRNAINRDYPRLMYHRWFMLSESIGNFLGQQISEAEFTEFQDQEEARLQQLVQQGLDDEAKALAGEIKQNQQLWAEAIQLRRQLIAPLAKRLMEKNEAVSIQLFLNRRVIPSPEQIRRGAKTRDPLFLPDETLVELGQWTKDDFDGELSPSVSGSSENEPTEPSEELPQPLSRWEPLQTKEFIHG